MRVVIFLIGSMISLSICAQDKIIRLNGERVEVSVKKVGTEVIEFTYPNEETINEIDRKLVYQVAFASGRVERVNERIIIEGEDDWEKVVLTENPDDVKGFKKVEDYDIKKTSGAANMAGVKAKAEEALKREAAKDGAHIVLVKSGDWKSGLALKYIIKATGYSF